VALWVACGFYAVVGVFEGLVGPSLVLDGAMYKVVATDEEDLRDPLVVNAGTTSPASLH
jgi:hypothetical protein